MILHLQESSYLIIMLYKYLHTNNLIYIHLLNVILSNYSYAGTLCNTGCYGLTNAQE